jgi:hypothetical protein
MVHCDRTGRESLDVRRRDRGRRTLDAYAAQGMIRSLATVLAPMLWSNSKHAGPTRTSTALTYASALAALRTDALMVVLALMCVTPIIGEPPKV